MRLTTEWYDTNFVTNLLLMAMGLFAKTFPLRVRKNWPSGVLLCHSQMSAGPPSMQYPWSEGSCSSSSPHMFGESVMGSYKLVIRPWLHATGRAFLTSLTLLMKTGLVTSGSSKVSHKFFMLLQQVFVCWHIHSCPLLIVCTSHLNHIK